MASRSVGHFPGAEAQVSRKHENLNNTEGVLLSLTSRRFRVVKDSEGDGLNLLSKDHNSREERLWVSLLFKGELGVFDVLRTWDESDGIFEKNFLHLQMVVSGRNRLV